MRVDFYLLNPNQTLLDTACRLVEKAYYAKQTVFVWCKDKLQSQELDDLLWTFKENSFIPHKIITLDDLKPCAVMLDSQAPQERFDVLLNLQSEVIIGYNDSKRLIELVLDEPEAKQLSRERYKKYKTQSYELYTHKLN